MIHIFVIDTSAERRIKLCEHFSSLLAVAQPEPHLLPHINLRPVSPHEVRFQTPPDICILAEGFLTDARVEIASLRESFPTSLILGYLTSALETLAVVEDLGRRGIDDFIGASTSAFDFMKRIILRLGRSREASSGSLVLVDSGKGGVGVTTIAAAIGEELAFRGLRTVLVDGDIETQDLSRYLQTRPFVNEHLQLIVNGSRPPLEEFVRQCTAPSELHENLSCLAPPAESDAYYDSRSPECNRLFAVLELLDQVNDAVVVDSGSVRGAFLRSLYKVANRVVIVVNNDPATLHSSIDKIRRMHGELPAGSTMTLVENNSHRRGLSSSLLKREFTRLAGLPESSWAPAPIPECASARRWPASGYTIRSAGSAGVRRGVARLIDHLALTESMDRPRTVRLTLPWSKSKRQVDESADQGERSPPPSPAEPRLELPHFRVISQQSREPEVPESLSVHAQLDSDDRRLVSGVTLFDR